MEPSTELSRQLLAMVKSMAEDSIRYIQPFYVWVTPGGWFYPEGKIWLRIEKHFGWSITLLCVYEDTDDVEDWRKEN